MERILEAAALRRSLRRDAVLIRFSYLGLLLSLMTSTVFSLVCRADPAESPEFKDWAGAAFGYGKQEVSIAAGYGFGVGF